MSHSADAISGTHLTQATAAAFRSTPTGRSTLDQLQSYYSPSSEDESGTPSFIRRPPATPGTAQTVNTTLTSDQFHHLVLNITESIRSSTVPSVPREDNPFAVARAEVYISQGLTFKFDGTTDSLAPWIKKFKSLRSSALWHEATYLTHAGTTYDILTEFTKIKEAYVKPQAEQRCTQENHLKSLKPENTTLFYARILGKVVISSVTDDFCTILQNYAGDELASDGPYLLWLLLTHFHTSTITYQDQLKTKIRGRTLAGDHQDDVESYLLWLRHHLDVLATISLTGIAGHSDLIEPIFKQLLSTTSTRLRRIIEDWHLLYHSEEKVLTPHSLVVDSDKKCKALRQSGQLYTTADADIMALLSAHRQPPPALLPTSGKQTTSNTGRPSHSDGKTRSQHRLTRPQWLEHAPSDPNQTHHYENRIWHWCPKCGDSGKWVCTHSAATHADNYVKKRKGDRQQGSRRPSPSPPPTAHAATTIDHAELAKLVAAQLTTQFHANYAEASMLQSSHNASAHDPTDSAPISADDW
jgi:hypothetical protein